MHTNMTRYTALLLVVAVSLLVAGCPGPGPDPVDWQTPVHLNHHLAYLDAETGRVFMLDPRASDTGTLVQLPGPEDPDDLREGFSNVMDFPDRSHVLFAAQDINAFHFVSDADKEVVLTLSDVPPILNTASFSADGRWMILHVSRHEKTSMREPRTPSPSGASLALRPFYFPNSTSILLNEHRLIVVDRETMESFSLDLPRNDIPISGLRFTESFRICESGTLCADSDARQMQLVVVTGAGRLWVFDPSDGPKAKVNVIPLSVSESSRSVAVTLRASGNLVEPEDGTDNREILFLTISGSREILALNTMWNSETKGLSFTLNKLPLTFTPKDIQPYVDRGALYLLALGSGTLASIHADSARVSNFSVSDGLSRIRPLMGDGNASHLLLEGGNTLEMVKLQDLNVFGSKNLTRAKIGFTASVVDVQTEGTWRALCLDSTVSRLAAIDLTALVDKDLSATVQRLDLDVASYLPDAEEGSLYLSALCQRDPYDTRKEPPLLCDVFALSLFEAEPDISQVVLENVAEGFGYLPATEEQPKSLIFRDVMIPDRLLVLPTDTLVPREVTGFLADIE